MTDNKGTSNTETGAANNNVDELVRIVNNHINPVPPTSPTGSTTRTYTSPLMGTSARAAKRRIDTESGPIRIEGTDIYNQQLQHHYQNVRQVLDDQKQPQTSNIDPSSDSRQSFSSKRDFFEQRFKTPSSTYDAPPRQQGQKIITTITTTPNIHDRTSSSSNESPSVDRVLEQAVELQKMSNIKSTKHEPQIPFIIERTEKYQVFLDSANHEIRRTPSISRTSLIPINKPGHATDLDQAQAHVERLTDDHQAIQNLTRVLQEHNLTTINEYKRLPSQTHPTSSSSPSNVLLDRTNLPIKSSYSVIDALLNNPLGTIDEKSNYLLNIRSDDIVKNLRNPEYLNSLKQPTKTSKKTKTDKKSSKKQPKEKKSKKKKSSTTDTVEHAAITPLISSHEKLSTPKTEHITTTTATTTTNISSEQTPLINPKEKKKQDKENKKQIKAKAKQDKENKKQLKAKSKQDKENKKEIKTKSKQKSKNGNYQVIDAVIGGPVTLRLPEPYLTKYNVSAPLSPSSPLQSIPPSIPSNTVVKITTTTTTVSTTTPTTPPPTASTTPPATTKSTRPPATVSTTPPVTVSTTPPATTTSTKPPATTSTTPPPTAPASKDKNVPVLDKHQTLYHLAKIVHDLQVHHSAALKAVLNTPTQSKEPVITIKQSEPVVKETTHQQRPVISSKQTEIRPQSEPVKPRVIYRYMDERGHVLITSPIAPSQLREQPAQQYSYRNTEPPYFYGRHIAVDDERRHLLPQYEQRATWQGEPKLPTTVTREDLELRDRRIPQIIEQSLPTSRTVPVTVEHERSSKNSSQPQPLRTYHYPNQQNVKLAWLPLSYPTDQQYISSGTAGYDTDSTISERSATYRPHEYGPANHYRYYNRSPGPSYYPPPPHLPYGGRGISPEYSSGASRNYIEVFRGGDFRETKPSEIYSLPLSEHIRTSPMLPTSHHNSRFDQYQSERYGTLSNRDSIPSQSNYYYYSNSLPHSRYQDNISPTTVHTSTYYTHRNPYSHRTVQSSPSFEYPNYIRQSKSFDYRPLRTKLQREYRITPNLLVDEWDYPQVSENIKYSTTSTTNRSGLSSPDDVFINNQATNKA